MKLKLELTIVISFIIGALFLLNENPSITGMAISGRELIGENPGTYSFYPSMKASIDYDFSDYEKIKEKMDVLVSECADKLDLDLVDCIKNNLNKINSEDFEFYFKYNNNFIPENGAKDWNEKCEKANESFFYDFVEFLDSCQNSGQTDCYCSMNIFDSNLEFSFDVLRGMNDLTFKYNDKIEKIRLKKEIESFEKVEFDGDILDDEVRINDIEFTKNIYIKNTPEGLNFLKSIDSEKDKRCKSENRYVKVCVISKNRKFISTNPVKEEKKAEFHNVVTRFAFYIKDLPPPPVKEVNAFDKMKASSSLILNWSESEATDVVSYNIYYSESDFKGKKIDEISGLNKIKVDVSSAIKVRSINIFKPMCQKLPQKECRYIYGAETASASIEMELKEGMLIYEENTKSFIYVLPMENEKVMYFGVSAIDRKGQESTEIIKTASAKSIDDLAPGNVVIIELPSERNRYKLMWQRPTKNIDGSELGSNVALTYDVYACKNSISSGSQLTSYPVGETDCMDFKIIAIKGQYPIPGSEEYNFLLD